MKEFVWKKEFPGIGEMEKHINKYVLLLAMCKLKFKKNIYNIEEETESLTVQRFSVYVDYLKLFLFNKKTENPKFPILTQDKKFRPICEKIINGKDFSKTEKKQVYELFAEYVNLKDIKARYFYYFFAVLILFPAVLLVIPCLKYLFFVIVKHASSFQEIIQKVLEPDPFILFVFFTLLITSFLWIKYYIFKGKFKSINLNLLRVNGELCVNELQKEFHELNYGSHSAGRNDDPYKNMKDEDIKEKFFMEFDLPNTFFEKNKEKQFEKKQIFGENNKIAINFNHFYIQFLIKHRRQEFNCQNFDWQLIDHVTPIDATKSNKSKLLKDGFKDGSKLQKKFEEFCKILEK